MKNFNLLNVEALSTREMACVKGGDGLPTPIIIVEEGVQPASERAVAVLTVNFVATPTTKYPRKKK